jgi:hypothetical protein
VRFERLMYSADRSPSGWRLPKPRCICRGFGISPRLCWAGVECARGCHMAMPHLGTAEGSSTGWQRRAGTISWAGRNSSSSSRTNGSISAGRHVRPSRSIRGKRSSGVQTSTCRASASTIQYSGTRASCALPPGVDLGTVEKERGRGPAEKAGTAAWPAARRFRGGSVSSW